MVNHPNRNRFRTQSDVVAAQADDAATRFAAWVAGAELNRSGADYAIPSRFGRFAHDFDRGWLDVSNGYA